VVALHAFVALASGLALVILLEAGVTWFAAWLVPSWAEDAGRPKAGSAVGQGARAIEPGGVVFHLGGSFLIGAAGGCVTAWVAMLNPLVHVLVLAIVVLALAALSALQSKGKLPIWYQLTQVAISPFGVLAGGLVRLRYLGIL
jgi:hypothetical protein